MGSRRDPTPLTRTYSLKMNSHVNAGPAVEHHLQEKLLTCMSPHVGSMVTWTGNWPCVSMSAAGRPGLQSMRQRSTWLGVRSV